MNIHEIISSIPYLTKSQLCDIYSEIEIRIKQMEEADRKYRECVRQRQSEIVDEMNMLLREFHTLSASLRTPDAGGYM